MSFSPELLACLSTKELKQWKSDVKNGKRPTLPISAGEAVALVDAILLGRRRKPSMVVITERAE